MDFTEKQHVLNPQLGANPISRFLWIWITPLLLKGRKKDLSIDDLYDRLPEDDASMLGDRMQRIWEQEYKEAKAAGRRPKFLRAARKFFGIKFFYFTIYVFINELVLRLSQPFILRSMVRSFANDSTKEKNSDHLRNQQYLYTAALIGITLAYALNLHHIYSGLTHLAMKGRIGTTSLIYRKIFCLSKTVQSEKASIGKLCNLVGSDANRFDHGFNNINMLLVGPLQLIILAYFLFDELGVSSLVGIAIIAGFLIPFQVIVGRLSAKYRAQVASKTDERGRMLSEIIMGIRIIKMYAWEKPFSAVIHKLRKLEIMPIRKAGYLRCTFQSINFMGKMTVPFSTFVIFVSLGNSLTADKAYFSIAVYGILLQAMAQKIPVAAAAVAELLVAIRRIEDFLLLDEIQPITSKKNHIIPLQLSKASLVPPTNGYHKPDIPRVHVDNVCAKWNNDRLTLQNISINLFGSQLVIVVGPVGCGKSSLLNLLISELPISSGSVQISGNISYANQEAWIFSGNIRQNILFGSLYDKTRYENIIRVCGLENDLEQFPDGDKTIVGERGVSLSGGQKARVGLARTLYRKADIYLIDDPLSALDTRVSQHIFEKCMKEHLDGTLRIVVTHQLQYLPKADHIIVFNKAGQITAQGKYPDLLAQKVDFVCFMVDFENPTSGDGDGDSSSSSSDEDDDITTITLSSTNRSIPNPNSKIESQEEKKATGKVTWKTYFAYMTAGNSKIELVVNISLFLLSQTVVSFTDKWLSFWTNEVSRRSLPDASSTKAQYSDDTYILVYSICVVTALCLVISKAVLYFHYCMSISVNLHNRMFASLVRAPVRFFDRNSSGRLLNRFTKDLNYIDEPLPASLNDTVSMFLSFMGVMAVVISTNYYLAIPCILLIFVLLRIRKFYAKTSVQIKRVESITKSPIFLHLSASVQGLTTIRGLEAEELVIDQFDSFLDINTSPTYLVMMGIRWMGAWMDVMGILFLTSVACSFIIFTSTAQGGNVGMAITITMNVLAISQWGMRQSTDTENYMTSVERIFEYCHIAPEACLESKDGNTKNWPSDGAIKFCNVSLSYDEQNEVQVLKNLNFDIKAKEKVGIVGRTGAGKSSLLTALFRLTEPQGDIYIDGVSIKKLGLHELRKNISIIPQDPVLFSGTMRYNLDPFEQFSDSELWKVLKEVNLADAVPSLDYKVSDSGGNYSVGQRQLVCLARAILRKNKIIVMDEATANVDPNTDNLIQQEIRTQFAECTIITIAHRLHSVIDNDRILVMENGRVQEFDTPANLLKNPEGLFSLMVNQAGEMAETKLRKIATG